MACGTEVCKYFWCLSVYDIGYDIGTEYYTITNIVPDIVPMYIVICASLSSIPTMFGGFYVPKKLTAIVDNVALDHTR
jgi:hypothetical protein